MSLFIIYIKKAVQEEKEKEKKKMKNENFKLNNNNNMCCHSGKPSRRTSLLGLKPLKPQNAAESPFMSCI